MSNYIYDDDIGRSKDVIRTLAVMNDGDVYCYKNVFVFANRNHDDSLTYRIYENADRCGTFVIFNNVVDVYEFLTTCEEYEFIDSNETHETGIKHDDSKTRWSLVDWDAMEEMVKALEHGVSKYGEKNYMKGLEPERVIDAMMRHVVALQKGERVDESGAATIGHVMANAMMLYEMESAE